MTKTVPNSVRLTLLWISRAALAAILGCGFALETPPAHAQVLKVLSNYGSSATDGYWPGFDVLAQDRWGRMVAANCYGGSSLDGAIYRISPAGTRTILHSFSGSDGLCPVGGVTLGTDGNFYGTAVYGGTFNWGTFYKIDQKGNFSVLYNFAGGSDGGSPYGAPLEGTDGNFYGTTAFGENPACSAGCGTVYKISPTGAFTLLHQFDYTDGDMPLAQLIQGTDRNFYGTTLAGGTSLFGVAFKITPAGNFSVIHNFASDTGSSPHSSLVEVSDGNLYGTTTYGGLSNNNQGAGVLYQITREGDFVDSHEFLYTTDGENPIAGPLQASDGNVYGANPGGGPHGDGTIYMQPVNGAFSVVVNFDGKNGRGAETTPLQHTNGLIYGQTFGGGMGTACPSGDSYGCGVFWSLDAGLPAFVTFLSPQRFGKAGQTIQIFGQGFTGATSVSFNGSAATFNVVQDTFMTAVVPSGATTGLVTVTTPNGILTSNVEFHVTP